MNARHDDLNAQIKAKQDEQQKEAQEPIRIIKHNESTSQGVEKLKDELTKLRENKKRVDFDIRSLKANIEKKRKLEDEIRADLK